MAMPAMTEQEKEEVLRWLFEAGGRGLVLNEQVAMYPEEANMAITTAAGRAEAEATGLLTRLHTTGRWREVGRR